MTKEEELTKTKKLNGTKIIDIPNERFGITFVDGTKFTDKARLGRFGKNGKD